MKKTKRSYTGILFFAAIIVFYSCKKEDGISSKELLVYLPGDYGMTDNRIMVPFVHTPVGVSGNTMTGFTANATREVPADIDVSVAADMTLVDKFNQQNNTTFLPLPQSNFRIVNPGKYKIKAGSLQSDSVKVEIVHPEQLTNPAGYLLPFSISSLEGNDKGATISANQKTAFLNITYEFNNIIAGQTPLTGTLSVRTAWSVSVSNTTSGALGPAMIDGNNTTAWRSSNSTTAAKWAIINMGSQQSIKGFQIVPNYVATAENATQMTISTSTDNVNWIVQGIWKGTGPATGSSAASPDIKGVNFISPVTAQYFRLDITALVSGGRVGIGEINGVQ